MTREEMITQKIDELAVLVTARLGEFDTKYRTDMFMMVRKTVGQVVYSISETVILTLLEKNDVRNE